MSLIPEPEIDAWISIRKFLIIDLFITDRNRARSPEYHQGLSMKYLVGIAELVYSAQERSGNG